jgi:hypothetical protein
MRLTAPLAALVTLACSPATPSPTASAAASGQGDAAASAPASAPSAAEAGASTTTPPTPSIASAAPPAAADAGAAPAQQPSLDALDPKVDEIARTEAPGMTRIVGTGVTTRAEGAEGSSSIWLKPATCYTVIAFSPRSEVEAFEIRFDGPGQKTVSSHAAPATDADNTLVLFKGKAAFCPAIKEQTKYMIGVAVKKGTGRVATVVYGRKR